MGEQSEYLINGDDCEVCGTYIGSGPGHPRKCELCEHLKSPIMREDKQDMIADFILECARDLHHLDFEVQQLNSAQYRVTHPASKIVIDVYPTTKKMVQIKPEMKKAAKYTELAKAIIGRFDVIFTDHTEEMYQAIKPLIDAYDVALKNPNVCISQMIISLDTWKKIVEAGKNYEKAKAS